MRRKTIGVLSAAAAGFGAVTVAVLIVPKLRKRLRAIARSTQRRAQYLEGKTEGVRYRLASGQPDPDVSDDILVDRIRSEIGPLRRQLDIPHVHVMVQNHTAILHGDVPSTAEAGVIQDAVTQVAGVRGVQSYLHVGLLPGDTRPSEGRKRVASSDAMRKLREAASAAGSLEADAVRRAVRAVLGAFSDRLPEPERAHLLQHLPRDVRGLLAPPSRSGEIEHRLRTPQQLVAGIADRGEMDPFVAKKVADAVLTVLAQLVPEEVADVTAVLPAELKEYWESLSTAG